jgi:organic hydroperoxide reductase OsmC/OhrA
VVSNDRPRPEPMNAARHATTRWLSNPPSGAGRLYSESKAFQGLPFSVPEGEPTPEETTPGELLAAAYSTFLATYLAQALEAAGIRARELVVDVWCRLSPPERPPRAVERIEVEVHGRVEDIENSAFEDAVRTTWETCRRSLVLHEDLHTTLHAALV